MAKEKRKYSDTADSGIQQEFAEHSSAQMQRILTALLAVFRRISIYS